MKVVASIVKSVASFKCTGNYREGALYVRAVRSYVEASVTSDEFGTIFFSLLRRNNFPSFQRAIVKTHPQRRQRKVLSIFLAI